MQCTQLPSHGGIEFAMIDGEEYYRIIDVAMCFFPNSRNQAGVAASWFAARHPLCERIVVGELLKRGRYMKIATLPHANLLFGEQRFRAEVESKAENNVILGLMRNAVNNVMEKIQMQNGETPFALEQPVKKKQAKRCNLASITADQWAEIDAFWTDGTKVEEIAKTYGMSETTLYNRFKGHRRGQQKPIQSTPPDDPKVESAIMNDMRFTPAKTSPYYYPYDPYLNEVTPVQTMPAPVQTMPAPVQAMTVAESAAQSSPSKSQLLIDELARLSRVIEKQGEAIRRQTTALSTLGGRTALIDSHITALMKPAPKPGFFSRMFSF
jgi:hypothetical protein